MIGPGWALKKRKPPDKIFRALGERRTFASADKRGVSGALRPAMSTPRFVSAGYSFIKPEMLEAKAITARSAGLDGNGCKHYCEVRSVRSWRGTDGGPLFHVDVAVRVFVPHDQEGYDPFKSWF